MGASTLEETRSALAAEWERRSPGTPEEIAAFYRESEELGADLEAWHATPERQAWTQAIVEFALRRGVNSVLDVGAGGGQDLAALSEAGAFLECAAVEPNEAMAAGLRERGVLVLPSLEADRAITFYDLVICIDVLEHVPDPDALLAEIVSRVPLGGVLAVATATHDHGTPLHLAELDGWTEHNALHLAGFVPLQFVDRMVIWERTAEKGVLPPTLLLCAYRTITVEAMESQDALIERGWTRLIQRGDALITRVRSQIMSKWYRDHLSDVCLMVDDDIVFRPEDAERVVELARATRSIACGAYSVRDGGHLACRALTPGQELQFGPDLEPIEIKWAATGFLAVHRDVFAAIASTMPYALDGTGQWWPVFDTAFMRGEELLEDPTAAAGEEVQPLSEDYAFSERARQLGYRVWMDPSTVLLHLSQTAYSVYNMKRTRLEARALGEEQTP